MRTLRRYFYREILASVGFVALAFLGLFYFIDVVAESSSAGRGGYTVGHAALYALLMVPSHLYELAPIAVLIGGIYALARMAQSSEFTILRTAGLGPRRALKLLAGMGLGLAVLTFVVGDVVAPWATQNALMLQARFKGGPNAGQMGIWLKDRQKTPSGEHRFSVNVQRLEADGSLTDIRLYEFNENGMPLRSVRAREARIEAGNAWRLTDVEVIEWPQPDAQAAKASGALADEGTGGPQQAGLRRERLAQWTWPSSQLSPAVVAASTRPHSLTTMDLARYVRHLSANAQAAQEYEIQFWKRALYPLACVVMMGLALPFAYLHARAGSMSWKVFGGIMLGISYVLLSNVSAHLGLLRNWTPWVAAASPSLIYLLLSLGAFAWLVRYR
jgi:lipopolysaccharide export system permease protein